MSLKSLTLFSIVALCLYSQTPQLSPQGLNAGCATIPGVGSPILMISNAQRYIEDAFNINNQYTQVKFIFSSQLNSATTNGQIVYRLAFTLTDYFSTKYIGIELSLSPFGIGGATINRFLLTTNPAALKTYIDPAIVTTNVLSCGDLKYVYSSYGKSPTNPLDYNFPGNNRNSAGLNILNSLSPSAPLPNNKTCVTANFLESVGFFGAQNANTPADLLNCLPNKNAVAAINIGCVNNTVTSLQLVYNNINDNGTTNSQFVGNAAAPAASITTIPLGNAERISFTSFSPNSVAITPLDSNGAAITNYKCGTGTANPVNVIISARDFLGLTSITTNGNTITSFQVTQYNRNGAA